MAVLRKAGIFDESATWVPYWRSNKTATATESGLLISGYSFDGGKRLSLIVVNPGDSDVTTDVSAPAAPAGAAIDAETGSVISEASRQIQKVKIKRHDFRLVILGPRASGGD
jgi:hypothetical protein